MTKLKTNKMKKLSISLLTALVLMTSCNNDENSNNEPEEVVVNENPATFKEIGSITIGG